MILSGDVGGTKVWLQLSRAGAPGGEPLFERRYASSRASAFLPLLREFLDDFHLTSGSRAAIGGACLGVAGRVSAGRVKVTNLPWVIDASDVAAVLGVPGVVLVNDFEAAAHGIDALRPESLVTLQPGERMPSGNRVLLGAGTGFGVAYAFGDKAGYRIVAGEGGHMGFAPADEQQAALWHDIVAREGRVSAEHVLSGPGLVRIHDFLRRQSRESGQQRPIAGVPAGPEAIVESALSGRDEFAHAAVDAFAACFGVAAGDHALAVLARGGVYLAGGIAPAILPQLLDGAFLQWFRAKGVHAGFMRRVPVYVVTDPRLVLLGAKLLAEQG